MDNFQLSVIISVDSIFLLLFSYSCLYFLPTPTPHPSQTQLPSPTSTLPFSFVHVSFIVVPENPCPHSPLAIVRLFLTSMSPVTFCLLFSFVDYVPFKGEIIRYLSLTTWLISLSIMLSSSIHAATKGISSFFSQWNSTKQFHLYLTINLSFPTSVTKSKPKERRFKIVLIIVLPSLSPLTSGLQSGCLA